MRGRYERKETPSIWSIIENIVIFVARIITIIDFIERHIEG